MAKILLLFFLLFNALYGDSYSFTELRYSDATGHYRQLEGEIGFHKDGLVISYPKNAILLTYKDDTLIYKHNSKILDLDSNQARNMKRYFDILKVIHAGDTEELIDMFAIKELKDKSILKPLGSMKYYIKSIELKKEQQKLSYVKLFLQNNDSISITIHDEIH